MAHIISEEQLHQLLDPDIPLCAKEIIVQEIKMTEDVALQLPPPTSSYLEVKAQMMLIFRLQKWVGYSSYPDSLPFSTWQENQKGYNIVTDKLTQISSILCPGLRGLYAEPNEESAEDMLDAYLRRRY